MALQNVFVPLAIREWIHNVSPGGYLSTVYFKSGAHEGETQDSGSSRGLLAGGPYTVRPYQPVHPALVSSGMTVLP